MTTNSPNSIPEEWLSAYLDNELDQEQRQLVEAACSQNPELSQLLEEIRATRQLVSHLPQFPSSVARRRTSDQSNSWHADLDDGLDAMQEQNVEEQDVDEQGSAAPSLATSSDQQLNRTLANESSEATPTLSPESSRDGLPARRLRWAALAAGLLGFAILASMLWPTNLGTWLSSKNAPTTSAPAGSGVMSDPSAAVPSTASDYKASEAIVNDSIQGGAVDNLADSQQNGQGATLEAMANPALMENAPSNNLGASSLQPSGQNSNTENDQAITSNSDLPSNDAIRSNAFDSIAAEAPYRKQLEAESLRSQLAPPTAAKRSAPPAADEVQPQEASIAAASPPPQSAPSLATPPAPMNLEMSLAMGGLSDNNRIDQLPPPATARFTAPTERKKPNAISSATWHRSATWTDDSVAIQFETNPVLHPLRPLLKNPYKAAQQLSTSNADQVMPIAILSANDRLLKLITDKLASQNLSPPLNPTMPGSALVLFLSKAEIDQLTEQLSTPGQPGPSEAEKLQLFWISPVVSAEANQAQVLIVNGQ